MYIQASGPVVSAINNQIHQSRRREPVHLIRCLRMTARYQIRNRGFPPNGGRRLVTRPKVTNIYRSSSTCCKSGLELTCAAPWQEFTCFSYDDDHVYRHDDSSLRWYYHNPLDTGVDLSSGFETFDKHDDSADEHLVSLLKSIVEHEKANGRVEVGLVTWRGMMTKVVPPLFLFLRQWGFSCMLTQIDSHGAI